MASPNLIACFLLVLVLLHSKNSTALTPQGDEENEAVNVEAGDRMNLLKSNMVIGAGYDVEVSNKKLKGRKMMMTKERKEESLDVEKERQTTGASSVVGKCKHRRTLGKCKKMSYRIRSHPLKEKMVGFTAFSADYHLPHPHPPRHN